MVKKTKIQKISRGGWNTTEWRVYNQDWNREMMVSKQDADALFAMIKTIQDKSPSMSKGTTIAIDKSSDIPRPKLKEFINDNGYKKVSKLDKADVIAVRRESIKMIEKIGISTRLFLDSSDVHRIFPSDPIPSILIGQDDGMDTEWFDVKSRCTETQGMFLSGYRNKKQDEQIDFLFSLIGSKATLVYDDVLMNEMNSDGLDLDDEIYDTLEGMLLSKETETFNLGIEMLSNVNLENNIFKIAVLLNTVFTRTHRFSAMSQIRNKNFKALINYVESQGIRWNQRWESFGMSMMVRFRRTEWEQNINDYIKDNINNNFKLISGGDVLQITNIVFE